jgi:hypothetical protein
VLRLMLAKRPSAATRQGVREAAAAREAIVARESAMLLLGLGAAPLRSAGRGLRVRMRRSKTDQQGQGQEIAVWANPTETGFCPLAALDAWLVHRRTATNLDWTASAASRATRPPLCAVSKAGRVTGAKLSDKAIARLVKQAALDAGLDRDAIPAARCTPAWPPLPGTRVRASPS